ncbi:GNAT family N-acetyltransferase [Novosphingobium sp. B 225]|uniref:GNAT family N-acetyltransferase n=1 Tax=Novosphingobium sp. B 225 TaxID=1961849 RepID=UPI0020CDB1C6|nr:GNAT family N-acetyltransferase [Novosphingobium sp. B 225]
MTLQGDHLDKLMAVMDAAFDPAYGEAWNRRQVEDALVLGNTHFVLIAATGQEPLPHEAAAGFFLSRTGYEEEELLLLAVTPACRRLGLGQTLLERLARDARQRGATRLLLEMRQGNPAEQLYRRFGFTPIGLRPNYYRGPSGGRIDAITFACPFYS